jgi:hypothetical protein
MFDLKSTKWDSWVFLLNLCGTGQNHPPAIRSAIFRPEWLLGALGDGLKAFAAFELLLFSEPA